jgi:hypothetical protein
MFVDHEIIPAWSSPAPSRASAPQARQSEAQRQEALLDEALKETFPASDPVSVIQIT